MHQWLLPEMNVDNPKGVPLIAFNNPLSCFLCNDRVKTGFHVLLGKLFSEKYHLRAVKRKREKRDFFEKAFPNKKEKMEMTTEIEHLKGLRAIHEKQKGMLFAVSGQGRATEST